MSYTMIAGLALFSFTSSQESIEYTRLSAEGPTLRARFELDSGQLTLAGGAGTQPASAPGARCFENNVDFNDGGTDALLYPAGVELFDWGVKSCGGSNFVESLEIQFASMAVPTSQGGPGGSLTLRVYEGATGFGVAGTELASITLTGLPSDGPSPSGSVLGLTTLTIDLGAQSFFLPDGPIGWSYENHDGLTAPRLVDVQAALGTENFFDVYDPAPASAGNYSGTFTLPPGGFSGDPLENTFYFVINEKDAPASVTTIVAGSNPIALSSTPPIVGSTWDALVDDSALPTTTATLLAITLQSLPPTPTKLGLLVIKPQSRLLPISIKTGSKHSFPIPTDSALVGLTYYAQGGLSTTAQGIVLTNGLELTVGTL